MMHRDGLLENLISAPGRSEVSSGVASLPEKDRPRSFRNPSPPSFAGEHLQL
ncbi:hypothetical protein TIFTF001_009392 [Ficus carica]|uniref:Uncharacterized protein n=1 Tax=Ficus carica TaxID=3494 RepID=A0AA87ZV69_FICCA|nr:hypothetical protein TIFTF001_009392 [Ficus carica]